MLSSLPHSPLTDNGNHWDPLDFGHTEFVKSFYDDVAKPEMQEWMLEFCAEARKMPFYSDPCAVGEDGFVIDKFCRIRGEGCPIELLKAFSTRECNDTIMADPWNDLCTVSKTR